MERVEREWIGAVKCWVEEGRSGEYRKCWKVKERRSEERIRRQEEEEYEREIDKG